MLAVYRFGIVRHDMEHQSTRPVIIPQEYLPLRALTTLDYESYYLVRDSTDSRTGDVEIRGPVFLLHDSGPSKEMPKRLVHYEGGSSAKTVLQYAHLMQPEGYLQILLIWTDKHSQLVTL